MNLSDPSLGIGENTRHDGVNREGISVSTPDLNINSADHVVTGIQNFDVSLWESNVFAVHDSGSVGCCVSDRRGDPVDPYLVQPVVQTRKGNIIRAVDEILVKVGIAFLSFKPGITMRRGRVVQLNTIPGSRLCGTVNPGFTLYVPTQESFTAYFVPIA